MKVKIKPYPTHRRYHNWVFEKLGWKNLQKVSVRIDDYDTWNMDTTLAHIVLPMLIQLKTEMHGAPNVDLQDVPENLHPTKKDQAAYTKNGKTDPKFFERWDWVIDEMIFAFHSKTVDWEDQFYSGEHDFNYIPREDGMTELVKGPNDTFKIDGEGRKAYQERISNGFRLFGRYYENLWD
jgi:hypothetical protein